MKEEQCEKRLKGYHESEWNKRMKKRMGVRVESVQSGGSAWKWVQVQGSKIISTAGEDECVRRYRKIISNGKG